MTDFPTLLYTSTCEIPTLLYTWGQKKVPLWAEPPRIGHYMEYLSPRRGGSGHKDEHVYTT